MANHYLNSSQKSNDLVNIKCAKAVFDIGVTGALAAGDIVYSGVRIPDGSIITQAWYFVNTVFTDGGDDDTTIKLGLVSDDDEFCAASAITANLWDAGMHGTLIGHGGLEPGSGAMTAVQNAASNTASYIHCTTDDEIIMTVAVDVVASGKLTLFVEYVASGDLA